MSNGVTADIQEILYRWWNGAAEPAEGETDFAATVQLLIGVVGEDPADSFDLIVCSPSRLAEYYQGEAWDGYEVLPGGTVLPITGVWLMKSWSRADFEAALQRIVPAFSPAPDFPTLAGRIGRVIPWEYDYSHDDVVNRQAGLMPTAKSFWNDEYVGPST